LMRSSTLNSHPGAYMKMAIFEIKFNNLGKDCCAVVICSTQLSILRDALLAFYIHMLA
jgi:hypothetical protein